MCSNPEREGRQSMLDVFRAFQRACYYRRQRSETGYANNSLSWGQCGQFGMLQRYSLEVWHLSWIQVLFQGFDVGFNWFEGI
jgi:hypothetical protein